MPIATRPVRGLLAARSLAALGASAPDPIIEVERPPPPIDMAVAGAKVFDALVLRPLGAAAPWSAPRPSSSPRRSRPTRSASARCGTHW